jgi:hypothetical protein
MGPEDHHEEPAEQDGYEKWLEERETARLAKLLKLKPNPPRNFGAMCQTCGCGPCICI